MDPLAVSTSENHAFVPQLAAASVQVSIIAVPSWQRGRDSSCAALLAGERLLIVTGPPGTGKTLLVQDVARILRFAGWRAVASVAQLPAAADLRGGGRVAVLIDEADRLSDAALQDVQAIEGCSVLLAGLTGLLTRCAGGARVSLGRLGGDEATAFIRSWLGQAGQNPTRLDTEAELKLTALSGGVPRLLAALLRASVWIADGEGQARVCKRHVEDAAAFRECLLTSNGQPDPDLPAAADHAPTVPSLAEAQTPALSAGPAPIVLRPLRRARALAMAGYCLVLVLVTGAGLGAAQRWPTQAAAVRAMIFARIPPLKAAAPLVAPGATDASAAPDMRQLGAETVPVAAPMPEPVPTPGPTASGPGAGLPTPASAPVEPTPTEPAPASEAAELPATAEAPTPSAETAPVEAPVIALAPPPAASPPASAPAPATEVLPPALIDTLVRRGNEMLALGDVSAARLLFGRAAAAGSTAAMVAMGASYDPAAAGPGAHAGADRAAAAQWYRLAADAGNAQAGVMLQRVERHTAK